MTTDVLERPDAALDEEDREFVTLTVADQLCGVPVLGVRDMLGDRRSRAFRWRRRRSPAASTCAAGSSPRSTCAAACGCRRRRPEQPRMSVVAEQGGELYALLVDQVSRGDDACRPARSSAIRRPCRRTGPRFSDGIYRLDGRCWWCWTSAGCWRSASRAEADAMPRTCLVVDDSRVVRKVARRILEAHGFTVTEAADGRQALDACRQACPTACCSTGTCR